jgi:MoxR-like ATPase
LIIATQNPIEQSGTYPLPEAQLDRFLLYIKLGYPSEQEELEVLEKTTGTNKPEIEKIISAEEIIQLQQLTREVHLDSSLLAYITRLIRATRLETTTVSEVKNYVEWGAGTRAGQALILCAKARALVKGRYSVIPEDIKYLVFPVLRHRISLHFKAEAEQLDTDFIISKLVEQVPVYAK